MGFPRPGDEAAFLSFRKNEPLSPLPTQSRCPNPTSRSSAGLWPTTAAPSPSTARRPGGTTCPTAGPAWRPAPRRPAPTTAASCTSPTTSTPPAWPAPAPPATPSAAAPSPSTPPPAASSSGVSPRGCYSRRPGSFPPPAPLWLCRGFFSRCFRQPQRSLLQEKRTQRCLLWAARSFP